LRKRGAPQAAAIAGLEYTNRLNLFALRRSFRKRNLPDLTMELTKPRGWLGGRHLGEYVGAAEKPVAGHGEW
jgi:hypothetical protein